MRAFTGSLWFLGSTFGKLQRFEKSRSFGTVPPTQVNAVRVPEGDYHHSALDAAGRDLIQIEGVAK